MDRCLFGYLVDLEMAAPLRRRFGFDITAAWIAEATGELAWILSYDGTDGFDAADQSYYASAERAQLDPDPAAWFETAERWRVRPVLDQR